MYACRTNPKRGLAVWCWGEAVASAEDWQRHLADIQEVGTWTHLISRPCVILHLMGGRFVPNATQRRDIARLSGAPDYRPNIAIVSRNPVIRTVIRMFAWQQGAQAYRVRAHTEVDEAIAWLEEDRGDPLPELRTLLAAAEDALGVAAGSQPASARHTGGSPQ